MIIHSKSKRKPMKMEWLFGIIYTSLLVLLFVGPPMAIAAGVLPDRDQHADKMSEKQKAVYETADLDK